MTSPELAGRVKQAVEDGNMTVIASLGLRATPALAALILSDLEGIQIDSDIEPLFALATVDPGGACRLAVDHFDEVADNIRCHAVLPARAGFEQQGFIGEAANDLGEVSFASRSIHAVSDVKLSKRMFGECR